MAEAFLILVSAALFVSALYWPIRVELYPEVRRPWRSAYAVAFLWTGLTTIFLGGLIWRIHVSGEPADWRHFLIVLPSFGMYVMIGRYAQIAADLKRSPAYSKPAKSDQVVKSAPSD